MTGEFSGVDDLDDDALVDLLVEFAGKLACD